MLESAVMPSDEALQAVRAAVEVILPPVDGRLGAAELGAHQHVVDMIELAAPGFVDLVGMLLDAYAPSAREGVSFAQLTPEERSLVIRTMAGETSQDVLDMVDALMVFTLGAVYSEWSRFDPGTRTLGEQPGSWSAMGYPGPSEGHPNYREDI